MLNDCTILLVEDEALIALDLAMTLEDEGAQVEGPFATVPTALPACCAVDVALLDVDLCGTKVFPVADRLMAEGKPFVFHTGRPDRELLAGRYGADVTILLKPTRSAQIVEALREALDRARARVH
ncbi:response regulator [Jannaschia rubra]|uniref:Response regulator n=1 Tax=Jannaschia rubra TaxID=282197 RepID=A0A0M6XPW7_9RHOB|nr:response regulator [Jannaschia rubra]CTQ32185.1 response regulator [Jannaschia rubra]SFG35613.1 CheY chemotaxis protein or a CheY-like REC (receiver) domain [Jannaschia rubra]